MSRIAAAYDRLRIHRHTTECIGCDDADRVCCADAPPDVDVHGYTIRTHAGDIPVAAPSITDACAIAVAAGHRLLIDGLPVGRRS